MMAWVHLDFRKPARRRLAGLLTACLALSCWTSLGVSLPSQAKDRPEKPVELVQPGREKPPLKSAKLFSGQGAALSLPGLGGGGRNMLVPYWTRSYQLYKQPHAIWLSNDAAIGANLGVVKQSLTLAEATKQVPELVVYTIPLRDLGQSSEGGFKTYQDYLADNELTAKEIETFVKVSGLRPRIYLEPDALALTLDYKKLKNNDADSQKVYKERIELFPQLIQLYKNAGALVYLDAAHSGWFDYGDSDVQNIAKVLNDARIDLADGLVTNVSNRQKLKEGDSQSESHYLARLLPLLNNKNLDVVVDTSRNGGDTSPRLYHLALNGQLVDNEYPQGRLVGSWRKDSASGEIFFNPFWGSQKSLSQLLGREKYQFDAARMVLVAPPWLDPIGDVKLGMAPSDNPPGYVKGVINRLRYIKPPDDCDGSLNCPPGESKFDIAQQTHKLQPPSLATDKAFWQTIIKQVGYR